MNLSQMTTAQLGLILMGLRAIYVEDVEGVRIAMIEAIEKKMSERGVKLAA